MSSKFSLIKALTLGLSLVISCAVNAELTQVSVLIEPTSNDCGNNKYFDDPNGDINGFSNCRIFVANGNELAYLSDVIIKFGGNDDNFDSSHEISSNYTDSIHPNDFSLTFDDNTNTSGSWVYNNNVFKYPDIRFWTAKAGNDFLLFWMVNSAAIPDSCMAGSNNSNLSYACMSLAESVTTGTWTTPENKGLSHITFFGGLCSENDINFDTNCGDTPQDVPEPATFMLFALALLGIAARRKVLP